MRRPKKLILDIDRLRRDLRFDHETGKLHWQLEYRRCARRGHEAGRVGNRGYVNVKYRGREWLAHVLIWAIVNGEVPVSEIDHADRNPANNRLANLRLATRGQNASNRGNVLLRRGAGVTRTPSGRWQAQISLRGKNHFLGNFATRDEARAAFVTACKSSGYQVEG